MRLSSPARALVLVAVVVAAGVPAAAREISWPRVQVEARLEADGTLAFRETQWIVFDGDWNGGERKFRVVPGQRLEIDRLVRIEAGGAEEPLTRGDLSAVDHWNWAAGHDLRWRSRLPSDPPFAHTMLVYRIEGRYTGVLQPLAGKRYRLDHDFAFADRAAPIDRFVLQLTLDPAWSAVEGSRIDSEVAPLAPGRGDVVRLDLAYVGPDKPARASAPRIDRLWIVASIVALWLFAGWRARCWLAHDRAVGRFEAPVSATSIDRAWLEQRVFAFPPEVIGAAWDRRVGSAEVAAMLARLVQEGKLESHVEHRRELFGSRDVLHLALRAPRESFTAEEAPLIAGMFPLGDTIDTDALREHYKNRGFDPAAKVRGGIEAAVAHLRGFDRERLAPRRLPTFLMTAAALALLGVGALLTGGVVVGLAAGLLVVALPALIVAGVARRSIRRLGAPITVIVVMTVAATGAIARAAASPGFPLVAFAGALLFEAALVRSMFNLLATRESPEALARRREMLGARDYLRAQLALPRPDLDDRWFPWIVAFGLAPEVDRWSHAFGGVAAGATGVAAVSGGSGTIGSSAGSSGGWSGGGGAFGGAGATASFASAVSSMAAGVASSSSSGGGGGGGGSSGGGGGGGW